MKRTVRLPTVLLLLGLLLCLPALPAPAATPYAGWTLDWLQQVVHWLAGSAESAGVDRTTAGESAGCLEPCSTADPVPTPGSPTADSPSTDTTSPPPPDEETYPMRDPNG